MNELEGITGSYSKRCTERVKRSNLSKWDKEQVVLYEAMTDLKPGKSLLYTPVDVSFP